MAQVVQVAQMAQVVQQAVQQAVQAVQAVQVLLVGPVVLQAACRETSVDTATLWGAGLHLAVLRRAMPCMVSTPETLWLSAT